ncbi:MAG: hypothetical protein A3F24_00040 [Candidatus Colwellbacteria bacterium RIFCSPHIGHO2_12_FULL_44_17]|uniref:Band 7 domain-containing protein n=1 Tax=Candidatus Colwellbacteria bacterium RIFCSPHIGHO2_12_FULL_44_17 TaxID=1797689 RepID=A0A1G1Z4K7_9BACT|nr:MAG: hypothetical protein A3F24_00040 [Candidatus Colwellbacteria bacterium RIFCSPHIGHO2_12_FULL_44_17]
MKTQKLIILLSLIVVIAVVTGEILLGSTSKALGAILALIALVGLWLLHDLRNIPAKPATAALVTFYGDPERAQKVKKRGLRLFFLRGILYDYIPIEVEKQNIDIMVEGMVPGDHAPIKVIVSLTYVPNENLWRSLWEFQLTGGKKGVEDILRGLVQERISFWIQADGEGPKTGLDALKSREDAVAVLVKRILGEKLSKIPSDIPTPILFKYFDKIPPNEYEKKQFGENWSKVKEELDNDLKKLPDLIKILEERKKVIEIVKKGEGSEEIPGFGVVLKRLNVKIEGTGKWIESAQNVAKEKMDSEAEAIERDLIIESFKKVKRLDPTATFDKTTARFQADRGKIPGKLDVEEININITGISDQDKRLVGQIAGAFTAYDHLKRKVGGQQQKGGGNV